jgi:RluA family pseudouridine synthase
VAHRIDRETSGILVVAKNQPAFDDLQKKFQDRDVSKTYNAFVYGRVTADAGTIDLPIGRSKGDFRRWSAGKDTKGTMREAVTDYKVVHKTNEVTFVEAKPQTGRTHQIRVHLRALGHPVVCDTLYAPRRPSLLGFTRLALHARDISFIGVDGMSVFAEAPYPADFENALKNLGIKGK